MKNNTNTNNNAMSNFPTTVCHITLRGKNGELVSWRGYERTAEATFKFFELVAKLNEITDGSFSPKGYDYPCYADEHGNTVSLEKDTGKLLCEILFDTRRFTEQVFDDFFKGIL